MIRKSSWNPRSATCTRCHDGCKHTPLAAAGCAAQARGAKGAQNEAAYRSRHYERVANSSLVCLLNLGAQLRDLVKELGAVSYTHLTLPTKA